MSYYQTLAGYDRSGRPVDQYGNLIYQAPVTPYADPQQRVADYTRQPAIPQQPAQAPAQQQSQIMSVTGEQQARDYPLDLSGAPQIFVTQDDSFIFVKRFNLSTGLAEFETYVKKASEKPFEPAASAPDGSFFLNIVSEFSSKLETMYDEIQALRKDVQNGNKPRGDSKSVGKQKSSDAADDAANAEHGSNGS